jgi:hypothetical protein
MSDPVDDGARAAAQRLAIQYGPGLTADVEEALRRRFTVTSPDQYPDPVTLGSLIVAIAALAWNIYDSLRAKTPAPPAEVVKRTVQTQLRETRNLDTSYHEQIITITVEETLRAGVSKQSLHHRSRTRAKRPESTRPQDRRADAGPGCS